tara:strand:+ start:7741 stop:9084 length:1344 start_codon:yes stop_codon:yes gene_type:complete
MKISVIENPSKITNSFLDVKSLQSYYPIMTLFKKKCLPWSVFINRFYLIECNEKEKIGFIKDAKYKSIKQESIFIKYIPIIDILEFTKKKYLPNDCNSLWVPHARDPAQRLHNKLYSYKNTAYCESFCMSLLSKLVENNESKHFPKLYGSYNGITSSYTHILDNDEYQILLEESWFTTAISKNEISIVDLDNDSDGVGMVLTDIPCQILVMEQFPCTFNSIIKSLFEELKDPGFYCCFDDSGIEMGWFVWKQKTMVMNFLEKLKAWVFQISVALTQANKIYNFVHNDLHVENIMMHPTDSKFIEYNLENGKFKVPTFGYIIKIIDYGRAICKYKKKIYMGDVFDPQNEAGKQYIFIDDNGKRKKIDPNPSFDLARFASSFFEELRDVHIMPHGSILTLMRSWTFDDNTNDICETEGFDLYIQIAHNLHRAIPSEQLKRRLFQEYFVI